ncbi:VIT1/CCC1 transporter family protein [Listeria rocourtiae]|uniref:VIT1/CCC1 transporter family protein n=1 Tax=Listeria rocourtiae TaxID=647910 RepID=UPI0021AB3F28|nr:VIT family protein [Listeria rocourtiae]
MKNSTMSQKLNILRAGVLGANDGIVSVAGIVIGVAGATTEVRTIFIAGIAGLVAGALSMAGGEYVSVSTQKDTEKAVINKEKAELANDYDGELEELADIYIEKGLSKDLAKQVATQLMEKDALAAHSEAELGLQLNDYANPWQAALSSLFSFAVGAVLPLLTILLLPPGVRIALTFIAVLIALALTGYISAYLGEAPKRNAVLRNMLVGMLTMLVTYGVGAFVGV